MKKIYCLFALFFLVPITGFSEDLLQVYHQAQHNDPTFKAAESHWLALRQQVPIKRAALLPNLTSTGSVQRQHIEQDFIVDTDIDTTVTQFQLNLSQPIFNYTAWMQYQQAQAVVRQAQANYYAAAEDLMIRTSQAYFDVLQAYELLQISKAQTRSLEKQYNLVSKQFKLRLITITGVQQVKTSLDTAIQQEIVSKNDLTDKLENLRKITGIYYTCLKGLKNQPPLIAPTPRDINAWVYTSGLQNFNVQAAKFETQAAHENIKAQFGNHLPVINGTASYNYTRESDYQLSLFAEQTVPLTTQTSTIGIQANLPIYQGGLVNAQTREAAFQFGEASAKREETFRKALANTRQSYLGVMSGIGKLNVDRETVISSNASLQSTMAGYRLGTNTVIDVLTQQSVWYQSQITNVVDQYQYLNSILNLKEGAGTLNGCDIAVVNSWLNKNIDLSEFNFNIHEITYPTTTPTPVL
jgi:outer membrane protein